MSATKQVVISGDLNAQTYSATVWDLVTGTTLKTFRNGGVLASKCLSLVSDQFLMAVQKDTAIIHYWALNGKQQQKKIICPAKVNVLTVTPDGHFAIVGIKEQLFIYQLSTGNLLTKLERHFQPITCIKVAGDSSYFISGGEDGYVFVWFTHEILSNTSFSHGSSNDSSLAGKEPKHSWSYHSAQITDIYCAYSRINGKCATCSIDQTCKIYDVLSGTLLVSLVFDTPLWSVTMDAAQYFVFVGGENGNIYETKLYEKPSQIISRNDDREPMFLGHSAKITCLSTSVDGLALVSGSYDCTIKIWHIISKQCMRTIRNKGPVNNLIVAFTPHGLINDELSLKPIQTFKKEISSDSSLEQNVISTNITKTLRRTDAKAQTLHSNMDVKKLLSNGIEHIDTSQEIKRLKSINEQLYNYAMEAVFKSIAD